MAKLTLADIGAGFGLVTTYNDNSALIEAAIENTLSRDGTGPNQMEAEFDMNSFRIVNLADGIDLQDAVTLFQLNQVAGSGLPPGVLDDILVNDGSMFVTANVIPEKYVTDHEAALTITESQISDLAHTTDASDLTSGVLADARVQESNVTQHQAALSITESQISDLQAYIVDITGEPIGDLSDVFEVVPADNDVLVFNFSNSRYENRQLLASDISGVIGGSGVINEVAVFGSPTGIVGDPSFQWDSVANELIIGDGTGGVSISGTSSGNFFSFKDTGGVVLDGESLLTPNFAIIQSGVNNISMTLSTGGIGIGGGVAVQDFVIGGNLNRFTLGDGTTLRVRNSSDTDWMDQLHNGTDYNFVANNTTDINFSGYTGTFNLANYSFPLADGAADQVLVTDGAGVLSYKDQAIAGGLLSGQYRFATSTVAADPGSGLFRYNNATPASVTQIFIDDVTSNGVDISNILSLITTGDRLYIQSEADSAAFIVFNVTAPITDNTGWFTIDGTVEASGTLHGSNVRTLFVLQIGGAGATGDVFKVGTPVNNQVGVWTGDGTLEGDTGFQWNGSNVNNNVAGGLFRGSQVRAGAIINETGSATNPTILPNVDDLGSGLGSAAANELSIIANSVEGIRVSESGGLIEVHFTDELRGANTFGPGLVDVSPTDVIPNILVRHGTTNTGIGSPSGNELSFIGGGVELARVVGAGLGGLFANNTLTGPGIERVLTLADLGLANIVEDLTPQLGADLDTNGFNIENLDTSLLGLSIIAGSDGSGIGGTLTLRAGASGASGAKGGSVLIEATNGAGGGAEGGDVTLVCGNASGSGDDGGDFLGMGGNGVGGGGDGGNATIEAGRSVGGGIGGIAATVGGVGGNGANTGGIGRVIGGRGGDNGGSGGNAEVTGGAGVSAGSDGDGGDVVITGGAGAGAGTDGDVILAVIGATNIVFDVATGRLIQGAEIFAYQSELFTTGDEINDLTAAVVWANIPDGNVPESAVTQHEAALTITESQISDLHTPSVANAALQVRRTTDYTLTTAFVDVTLDATDIETDAAIIEHDAATDDINLVVAGTYKVDVDYDVISTAASGDPVISVDTRVRLNDAGTGILGSVIAPYSYRDGSVGGDDGNISKHISNSFIFTASASDKITLQLGKTEITGSETFNVSGLCIKVVRLL